MSRRHSSRFHTRFTFDRETAHGILTVAIFAVAALLLLSLFEFAGRFGRALDSVVASAFGWERLALPMFLLAIGIHEVAPARLPLKVTNALGFLLFFLSLNPLVHTASVVGDIVPAHLEKLGGKLGLLLSEPAVNLFGRAGALTIFAAFFLISFLLIFNTSVRQVVNVLAQCIQLFLRFLILIAAPFRWMRARQKARADLLIREEAIRMPVHQISVGEATSQIPDEEGEKEEEEASRIHVISPKPRKRYPHVQIPIELLTKRDQRPTSGDIQMHSQVIQRTLENFGIPVEMGDIAVGPTVTQFTLKPAEGVKLAKITALHNDLALALAAHPIRIEAPIPGKSLVGIEVPNQSVATVGLREMLEAREWRERWSAGRQAAALPFVLGRDVSGRPWIADLSRMPHLLVAGATGSGKSVCLNILITSLMYSHGPDALKLILVDPKRVELQTYNGIPHLLTPVVTDVEKTVNALKWVLREMDRRFDVLSKFGARDIASYNTRSDEKLPSIVVIIDELADLMATAMQDVEGPIVRLAQMARAVGIHLVLATQRPSVDVLTGLIKANIPARIAFAVASSIDSRTILDQVGAEKLLGRGDMLFQMSDMSSAKRLQGAFVSDEEIGRVVEFLKSKFEPADYDLSVTEKQGRSTSFASGFDSDADSDELLGAAKEEILRAGKASASLLQRRLKIGYARAARILDLLEEEGFIGAGDGAKPREILNAEFTRQLESYPLPSHHSTLEQVNREIPDIEEKDASSAGI